MIGLTKWNPVDQWDPFKELEAMENRLGMLFGRLPGNRERKQEAMALSQWAPLVDITEDTKEYVVKAELPEMKKEEVKVSVEDGVLSISGERSLEKEDKDRKYHRIERAYGSFSRSFTIPEGTDTAKVTAEFKDGVLKVHLPKNNKAAPKAVQVKVE
jgi:HSP20 family protein